MTRTRAHQYFSVCLLKLLEISLDNKTKMSHFIMVMEMVVNISKYLY